MKESMYDTQLVLKDAGLVAASAAATVGGEAAVLDLGGGLVEGKLYIDVSAIEVADDDELYAVAIQGSDTADFSTGSPVIEELAVLNLGAAEVVGGNQDSETGRYVLPFRNEKGGTVFRYVRAYTTVSGTVATGINFTAWIGN